MQREPCWKNVTASNLNKKELEKRELLKEVKVCNEEYTVLAKRIVTLENSKGELQTSLDVTLDSWSQAKQAEVTLQLQIHLLVILCETQEKVRLTTSTFV